MSWRATEAGARAAPAGVSEAGERACGAIAGRRAFGLGLAAASVALLAPSSAQAFGSAGGFHARLLSTGSRAVGGSRGRAPIRWAFEVARRTSAPVRLDARVVAADARALLAEPFVVWAGADAVAPLTASEVRGLGRYLRLGGMLIVDDAAPREGAFGRSVRRELGRVLPTAAPVPLDPAHVVYRTFYLVDGPVGRVEGRGQVDAIVRGGIAQVLFLEHDLLGALAREGSGWANEVTGGARQRELAVRFAVNIAHYALCTDYKDDQVHAPWLMRRGARVRR